MKFIYLSMFLLLSACSQSPLGDFNGESDSPRAEAPAGTPNEGAPSESTSPTDPNAGPNFQIIKSQVLDSACIRCHSNAGGNRGGVNLETYSSVLQNLPQVESTVAEGSMPPRKALDPMLKDLLLKWIQLGAPQ